MKIGLIGSGKIGGALARFWAKAGHEVILSSRHLEKLKPLAEEIGPKASIDTPENAAKKGDIILLSIQFGQIPLLSNEVKNACVGKIVMDTANPYPLRDGEFGVEGRNCVDGSGVCVAKHFPGARMVKAFTTVWDQTLLDRVGEKDPIGIPLASDDQEALKIVSKLVEEAGFGPFIVGSLRQAKEFCVDTPSYDTNATLSELPKLFGRESAHVNK